LSDGDIRASSDRYLRNAIIAVLAYDRRSTLWDAARLLSVGEEGYAYRSRVAGALRTQPEFKEISEFFTGELSAQLADARGTTTAKLDAPVNKLARLLNSPSIKRVLLNDTLRVSFDEVIENAEVLVVKGALGVMGAGNTSVLMQLLVGMLDAALARRQDGLATGQRGVVALKVDEAPLVLNRGFTETMALKRSAGLETVACWQTDAQWIDREMRAQLDALFAHRVYFATASVEDARGAASLMMAEFSDTVRPGIRNLSTLGRPDLRLHLPRHFAIASWVTPAGRQAPFVAQTLPLQVDEQRVAFHQARQAERGGRYLEDLSQPHWERVGRERVSHGTSQECPAAGMSEATLAPSIAARDVASISDQTPIPADSPTDPSPAPSPSVAAGSSTASPPSDLADGSSPQTASRPADSYSELADIGSAHSVRWAKRAAVTTVLDPEPLDIEILALLSSLRHVLSSQIHRRFNQGRAATTTQRRLKRLSDAGLVARFQFHRRDGGGMPMCYAITPAGRKLLIAHGHPTSARLLQAGASDANTGSTISSSKHSTEDQLLRQARHDVRVAGWTLAVEQALSERLLGLRGPEESVISPRKGSKSGDGPMLAPSDLCLPSGRTPHDFMRTLADGDRVEVERFQSIRPDATLLRRGGRELLVEFDDRLPEGASAAKLERYDHFLAGWSANLTRFAHGSELPIVVFVCRDRARARECARRADKVLTASRAYAGEYPQDWEYPGRANILFAAERDAHEAVLRGWAVPTLPPEVRIASAQGDPRARDPLLELREIFRDAGIFSG
jgi:predicted transcriptional regulator